MAGEAKFPPGPGLGLRDVRGTAEDGRAGSVPLANLGSGFKFSFVSLNAMQEGWKTPRELSLPRRGEQGMMEGRPRGLDPSLHGVQQ